MPSPFPGMDPYLEDPAYWSDFHASFITYWRDAIAEALPEAYEARIDEKIRLVETNPSRRKLLEPDVAVTHRHPSRPPTPVPAGVAVLEPVTLSLVTEEEEVHERYIEILHRPERALVALLELLSPANKEEPGRRNYLAKRNAVLCHPVHLVEVDLLLGGQRLPFEEELPAGDYYAMVSRADRRPHCSVYAWTLRDRLPGILLPLLPADPDVWIDLASVFATTYERGRYARSLDYTTLPSVSLSEEARRWVLEHGHGGNGRA